MAMSDMLPALLQIATGVTFVLVLLIGTLARKAIKDLAGKLIAFGVLLDALGFFLLTQAVNATTSAAEGHMTAAAAAVFLLGAILVALGMIARARRTGDAS